MYTSKPTYAAFKLIALFLTLSIVGCSKNEESSSAPSANTSSAIGKQSSAAWFEPSLTVNNDASVCTPLLEGYKRYYRSGEQHSPLHADYFDKIAPGAGNKIISDALSESLWSDYAFIGRLKSSDDKLRVAELNVGNQYYGIYHLSYNIGWRSGFYHDIIVDKPLNDLLKKGDVYQYFKDRQIIGLVKTPSGDFSILTQADKKNRKSKVSMPGSPINAYTKNGESYIAFDMRSSKPNNDAQYAALFKIKNGLQLEQVCKFHLSPSSKEIQAQLNQLEGMPEYMGILSSMMGGSGQCGSSNAPARARKSMQHAIQNLVARPWANSINGKYPHWDSSQKESAINTVKQGLNTWAYSGLWNYKKHSEFVQLDSSIEAKLGEFYIKNYGLSAKQAKRLVKTAKEFLLVEAFNHGQVHDKYHELHRLILEGKTEAVANYAIPKDIESSKDDHVFEEEESLLSFAIDQSSMMQVLLDKGLSPNKGNAFNKTPLMYAAQYDDLASAKLLLERGADPNIGTVKAADTCRYNISTQKVTALHYAARYASQPFIDLLIAEGALSTAKDTKGRTPADYVKDYPRDNNNAIVAFSATTSVSKAKSTNAQLNESLSKAPVPATSELVKRGTQLQKENKHAEAMQQFRKALTADANNMDIKNKFAHSALRLGNYPEVAKTSSEVINSNATKKQKAAAYFNLALACEYNATKSGYHFSSISFDSKNYCYPPEKTTIEYFLESYGLYPTEYKAGKIAKFLSEENNGIVKRACKAKSNSGVKAIYLDLNHIYFLVDASAPLPYKSADPGIKTKAINILESTTLPLGKDYKVIRWKTSMQVASLDVSFDNGDSCLRVYN